MTYICDSFKDCTPMNRFFIYIEPKYRQQICQKLGITPQFLSYALHFTRNSSTARQARSLALQECHGILYQQVSEILNTQ